MYPTGGYAISISLPMGILLVRISLVGIIMVSISLVSIIPVYISLVL